MLMRARSVSVPPAASLTVKVTREDPAVVGVPVSLPSVPSVIPAGSGVLVYV
jgi:hypothetical protein